jgi:hypothetical protein
MYGDTGVMRRRATQLREQATGIRRQADQLTAQMDAIAWTGRAADAMRERVRERGAHLRDVAARHETAAESLDRHAHGVEELKEQIVAVQRRAETLSAEGDPRLATFTPPPDGHRDWLALDLPGL